MPTVAVDRSYIRSLCFAADASAGFCFPELFTILGRSLCGESIQDLGNG